MKIISSLACFFLTCLTAPAATIVISRGSPASPEGLQLANYFTAAPYYGGGYFIGVGTFATPPATSADLQSFMEFSSGRSPTFGSSRGYISGAFTANPSDPTVFNSREIYILVGNGPTLTESTEQVVLRSSGAPWLFPLDTNAAWATSIIATRRNVDGVLIEGMQPVFFPQPEGLDLVAMGPLSVPEASASLLSMLGLAFLSRRKR